MLLFISVVFYFLIIGECEAVEFNDHARFEVTNGNLFIVGAEAKNITLAVSPGGYLNINGDDLLAIISSAKSAANKINLKGIFFSNIQNDIVQLQTDREQIFQKLQYFEMLLSSTSINDNSSAIVSSSSSAVQSSLNYLKRRLNAIEANLKKDECNPNPCKNGGSCTDLYLKYSCKCSDGWRGRKCTRDVNECEKFVSTDLGCQNGAVCINTPGSYQCICSTGYYGTHCRSRVNDCSSGSSQELCDHGICVNQAKGTQSFVCICNQGWTTDGKNPACSIDVDECKTSPCSRFPAVACINVPGSFYCGSCPPGYSGDGFKCEDVNECLTNNGGCSTQPFVACINTMGSSKCGACPPGYSGDGITCVYAGRCNVNNGGCHLKATCQEIGTEVQCVCKSGFSGSGIGPYGCMPGGKVEAASPCSPNPCVNGRCIETIDGNFTCQCYIGFTGSTCASDRNACDSSPCANGGTCSKKGRSFSCRCTKNWTGLTCREERQFCGGFFKADSGVLEFPNTISQKYQPNLSCGWRIEVNSSKIINVFFEYFDLERGRGNECPYDWLQIYDGRDVGNHNMIGKFCGNALPNSGKIVTTGHELYLWFKSDRSANHMGFKFSWNSTDPTCGGVLNASVHGTVVSPGAPGYYPKNRDCYWIIHTNPGQKILFTFFQVQLESSSNCSHDYLEIYDGSSLDDSLLEKYCTTSSPAPLTTSGSMALIHFHSDSSGSSDKGFQISYNPVPGIPGCGGIFTKPSGEIRSVNNNGIYESNLDCVWLIRLQGDFRIKLEFISFALEKSTTCMHDFLEVRQGASEESPLIGRFCGNILPPALESTGNSLFVRFRTDSYLGLDGFVIRYSQVCGGRFTGSTGEIKSPGYPSNYQTSLNCDFIIEQPPGKAIRLQFLDFEMEYSPLISNNKLICMFDYLEVYDGVSESVGKKIGRFCKEIPSVIISTHNFLYLKLRSDYSVSHRGFYANYSTIDITCGGVYTAPTGTISSPKHPDVYPPNLLCTWIIIGARGSVIQLTFTSFVMEDSTLNGCRFDYLAVYNDAESRQLMGKFCGHKTPPVLTSGDNIISLVMKTDLSMSKDGFQIQYNIVNATKLCGGNYFMNSGVLRSPNYPQKYPNKKVCIWIIKVDDGQRVSLSFSNFSLEEGRASSCIYDRLEIRNGATDTSPLIGTYCGHKKPPPITSFSNTLFVKFITDSFSTDLGFEAKWHGSLAGCGGVVTGKSGFISSPNYPEPYGFNAECDYTIKISVGNQVKLNFFDVELEESEQCNDDFVELFDGLNDNAKSLGRYCRANRHPGSVTSSSNLMFIKFRSDSAIQGKGFLVKYYTECNASISGSHFGVVESPGFPNPVAESYDCVWTISVLKGNKINLTFTDFLIPSCSEFLEIKEGPLDGKATNLLGRFCATNRPPTIISSSLPKIFIRFVTTSESESSFRMEWIQNGCGGRMLRESGQFTSPNYPLPYPPEIECIWTIVTDSNHSIQLELYSIGLETSTDCVLDWLKVFDGPDTSSPLLFQTCAAESPNVLGVSSNSNYMTVQFVSDNSRSGRGFSAGYHSNPKSCGGLHSSHSGYIHSKGYPKNYDPNLNCFWTIQGVKNHRLNLTFIDFDLYSLNSTQCTDTFVEVLEKENGSPLFKYCGSQLPESRTIISPADTLVVHMSTGPGIGAKGFSAFYQVTCDAVINADEPGTIVFQNALHALDSFTNCTWKIVAPQSDGHVTLTIYLLNINDEYSTYEGASSNFLEVFNGPISNSTLIGKYTGAEHPPSITSAGNVLTVRYVYTIDVFVQIEMGYSSLSSFCGGKLLSFQGNFASPGYPGPYPANIECIWDIPLAPGNSLQLSWKEFSLPTSPYCNIDFIEVREGGPSGNLTATFCGDSIPASVLTLKASAWIKFKSSQPGGGSRFLASYTHVTKNELYGLQGEIANPLYPNSYAKTDAMTWRVTAPFQYRIQVTYEHLYFTDWISECYTGIKIFDGYDQTATALSTVCGKIKPDPILSSSNVIFIVLINEIYGNQGNKFHLKWSAVSPASLPTSPSKIACYEDHFLSKTINRSIEITSPNYPDPYPNNFQCTWKVRAPAGYHLTYTIKKLDIVQTRSCIHENLIFYDEDADSKIIGTYCLQNQTVFSQEVGTTLKIKFTSTAYLPPRKGFVIAVDIVSGGAIISPNGVIDFNWNGTSYRTWVVRKDIEWTIRVTRGRKIRVTFDKFDIAADPVDGHCNEQYLILRNGYHAESPFLGKGKYCGRMPEDVPLTTSDELYVKLITPFKIASFKLRFEEVGESCGERYVFNDEFSETIISSPNYPNVPPPKIECAWSFRAEAGKTLQIDFLERFDLTWNRDCELEYVEVRNGGSILSELLGRFCISAPSTIKSDDNMMYVKYFTNVSDPKNGFKAKVSLSRCGGTIRQSYGILTSPGYPKLPSGLLNCSWTIHTHRYQRIIAEFTDFDFPKILPSQRRSLGLTRQRNYAYNTWSRLLVLRRLSNCTINNYVMLFENGPPSAPTTAAVPPTSSSYTWLDSAFARFGNRDETIFGFFCNETLPVKVVTSGEVLNINFLKDFDAPEAHRGFKMGFQSIATECGGFLNTPNGVITSPHYPREIPQPYYCKWGIRVPLGRRITLKVDDFDLSGTYMEQRVYIHDDSTYSTKIATLSSSSPVQKEYKSYGNTMDITYYASPFSAGSHRGFKFSYSSDEAAECGGLVTRDEGVINPPQNKTSYKCEWIFPRKEGTNQSLILVIEKARLGNKTWSCSPSTSAGLLFFADESEEFSAQFCGNISDTTIRSPFTKINVVAVQGIYFSTVNFNLKYKLSPCGGVIKSSQLPYKLTSPNYPGSYPENTDCGWIVEGTLGQTIKVTFLSFDLEPSCGDFLSIRNGGSPRSPLIDQFCGKSIPNRRLVSQMEVLFLEFHSDSSNSGKGFEILLETNHTECGGVFQNEFSVINSPNFPNEYGPNMECEWIIKSEIGTHIGLIFSIRFHLEESAGCVNDFVKVYDYAENDWKLIATFCGRNVPSPINSTSNQMKILFRSDSDVQGDGFFARWQRNCGGNLEKISSGVIVSPGYPNNYIGPLTCEYLIPSEGQLITLNFNYFNLEPMWQNNCKFDYLEIVENLQTGLSSRFCGTVAPKSLTYRSSIKVIFSADSFANYGGFSLSFSVSQCGGFINSSQMIQYSLGQRKGSDCNWVIQAPKNMIVSLRFESIDLPSFENCDFVHLIVTDGSSNTSSTKLCGQMKNLAPILSSSNTLILHLTKSLVSYRDYAFTAFISFTYGPQVGCGGIISLQDDAFNLMSPDIDKDGNYEEFLECQWLVTAPESYYQIIANINFMDIKMCNDSVEPCLCDYLEFRDGPGPKSEIILTTCGRNITTVISSGNKLWIRFVSDGSYAGKGFKISLNKKQSVCGISRLNATTTIQEFSYYIPSGTSGTRCSWFIAGTPSDTYKDMPTWLQNMPTPIHLRIVQVDLDYSDDCTTEYLAIDNINRNDYKWNQLPSSQFDIGDEGKIYRGNQMKKSLYMTQKKVTGTTKYCGTGKSVDFYAAGGNARVSLYVSSHSTPKGFKLEYSLSAACGRNFTDGQGRIRLFKFLPKRHCFVKVIAPQANQTISLYFLSFTMPQNKNCSSYFEIRDGDSSTSPLINKICGFALPSPIFSTTSSLWIDVYADSIGYQDIDISYTTTDQGQGCGGHLYNFAGVFTSPFYPQNIRNSSVCRWDVAVPVGLTIVFKFSVFDLGPSSTCQTDFIQFLEYADDNSALSPLYTFCGKDNPAPIRGRTNKMVVKYARSVHNGGTGWRLLFSGLAPDASINYW